jgi:hypothetical protein
MAGTAAPTTSGQALNQMNAYQSGMKTPDQLLQQEQQSLGTTAAQQQVTGLRQAINNSTNLLNNVAPSVMGRTGNSLVTSAQANAQIANEQAPINQQLNQENNQYSNASQDYANLEQKAENQAAAGETAQQNQLGYLQNIYNALYGQEQAKAAQQQAAAQAAQQQRQFEQSLTEQKREANLSSGSSSGTPSFSLGNLLSGLAGGSSSNNAGALMTKRADGGFNISLDGRPINAAQYAHVTGQSFRSVLQQMANKGDSGAKAALGFVGNDFGYDPTKVTNQRMANLYKALTGRTVQVYRPSKSSRTPNNSTNVLGQTFRF